LLKEPTREARARTELYGEQTGFYRTRAAIEQAEAMQMSKALQDAQPGFTELIQQGKASDANLPAVTRALTLGISKYPGQTMSILAEVGAMQQGRPSPRAKQATGDLGALAANIGKSIDIYGLESAETKDAVTRYGDALERLGMRKPKAPISDALNPPSGTPPPAPAAAAPKTSAVKKWIWDAIGNLVLSATSPEATPEAAQPTSFEERAANAAFRRIVGRNPSSSAEALEWYRNLLSTE